MHKHHRKGENKGNKEVREIGAKPESGHGLLKGESSGFGHGILNDITKKRKMGY